MGEHPYAVPVEYAGKIHNEINNLKTNSTPLLLLLEENILGSPTVRPVCVGITISSVVEISLDLQILAPQQ